MNYYSLVTVKNKKASLRKSLSVFLNLRKIFKIELKGDLNNG